MAADPPINPVAAPSSHGKLLRTCLLPTLLLLTGCAYLVGSGPEIQQRRRFTIVAEPIRHEPERSMRPYPATVQLKTLDIATHYNQLEILSRSSPYELRRDRLHVWGLRPREMLTQVIAEYLQRGQLFERLTTDRELLDRRPDYVLSGSISALERFDSGDRWFARLVLNLQLSRQTDGQVLWRGDITRDDEIEVFAADMEHTVQALSEILRRNMELFVYELDTLFMRLTSNGEPAAELTRWQESIIRPETEESGADTVQVPDYYELIPGKLAP